MGKAGFNEFNYSAARNWMERSHKQPVSIIKHTDNRDRSPVYSHLNCKAPHQEKVSIRANRQR